MLHILSLLFYKTVPIPELINLDVCNKTARLLQYLPEML
jgi:hypothetical protein